MRVLLCDDDLGRWAPGHVGTMDPEALALAYAYPELTEGQSWVRANFISSLDG
ncbi:MAG: pyrimidine reductase family protein, partial [Phycicoccus sp.]|nr:pyrimidine reductase family protein [Phycicoccus sp.]